MLEMIANKITAEKEALKKEIKQLDESCQIDKEQVYEAMEKGHIYINTLIDIQFRRNDYCQALKIETLPLTTEEYIKLGQIKDNDKRVEELKMLIIKKADEKGLLSDKLKLNANSLINYIERIEKLTEEKKSIQSDIKEVFANAKAEGYDPRIMKIVLKLRAMPEADKNEIDVLTETYRNALNV